MNMKKIILTVALSGTLFLGGAEWQLKSNNFDLRFSPKGGALTRLEYKGRLYTMPKQSSFTERALCNLPPDKQLSEQFGKLEFAKISSDSSSITFSAAGKKAFDWLRITKRYAVSGKGILEITYTLTNRSDVSKSAGIWIQTFLRRSSGTSLIPNIIYQLRNGKITELRHPGRVSSDEWSLDPRGDVAAVGAVDEKSGVLVKLPSGRSSAFYSWFHNESTLEFFLRQQRIDAGKSDEFKIVCSFPEDLKSALRRAAAGKTLPAKGEKLLLPYGFAGKKNIAVVEDAPPVMPETEKFMDVTVKKQFNPSIRSVLLPPGSDPEKVSVYPLANGNAEFDRPIDSTVQKLPNGRYRLLFAVPQLDPRGLIFVRIKKEGVFDAGKKHYLGSPDFPVRIVLDRGAKIKSDPALFAGGPDILHNGSFEKLDKKGNLEGFGELELYKWRNYWSRKGSGSFDNSAFLRIESSTPRSGGGVNGYCILEPGRKYTASVRLASDNPGQCWNIANVEFFDAEGRELKKYRKIFENKKSYPWRKVVHTFYAPEDAVAASFRIAVLSPRITLSVDDLKIVPEDISLEVRSAAAALRDQLLNGHYAPLAELEKISAETITPHTPWFKPMAEKLPEILFCCPPGARQDDTTKRLIVELAQRMELRFRYIPLLQKIIHVHPSYGIMPPVFAPELEAYTLQILKDMKHAPRLLVVAGVDFKKQVQREFVDILKSWIAGGCGTLFVNCKNIPAVLTGKKVVRGKEYFQIPVMRDLPESSDDKVLTLYSNGKTPVAVFRNAANRYYLNPVHFRGWQGGNGGAHPAYNSKDYPFWEYFYLPLLKALRYTGGIVPQVKITGTSPEYLSAESTVNGKIDIQLRYFDDHRQLEKTSRFSAVVKKGANRIKIPAADLPGGMHIAEYTVSNNKGVLDAGAFRFDTPERIKLQLKFASPDRTYLAGKPVRFTVSAVPASDIEVEIEDSDNRIVARQFSKKSPQKEFSFALQFPWSMLYRVKVKAVENGRVISRKWGEFSLWGAKNDIREVYGMLWFIGKEFPALIRNLGFDHMVINFVQNANALGFMRSFANSNLQSVPIGVGEVFGKEGAYRADKATDPVRNPCFSDPEVQRKAAAAIKSNMEKQEYKYYNIRNFIMGDENFLGSTVCFSRHCLKSFREFLKKRYTSVAMLNKAWKSNFKSWDEVVPVQLNELAGKDILAPWLEHKEFMTFCYADRWLGSAAEIVRKIVPDARMGLSGSQIPGYSYNWEALMKHISYIAYYGGIQTQLIHDFGKGNMLCGQWGGGYAKLGEPAEGFMRGQLWQELFRGANLMCNWHGTMFNGDVTPTENMRYYSDTLLEMKKGIGKLFLSLDKNKPEAALLHSQGSLFAAKADMGKDVWHHAMSSWDALLTDMRINYRFASSEELEMKVPDVKLFILPAAIVLSEKQLENLKKFVAQGGTLVADFAPGMRCRNGNLRSGKSLEELFGTIPAEPVFRNRRISVAANKKFGIPGVSGNFMTAGNGDKIPVLNRIGKGRVILLNMAINGYHQVISGGVGGENTAELKGSMEFRRSILKLMNAISSGAGVRPFVKLTAGNGEPFAGFAVLRGSGNGNRVLGMISYDRGIKKIDPARCSKVHVELDGPGHIYDSRKGKYLGYRKVFTAEIPAGDAGVFVIAREKIGPLEIAVPPEVVAGEQIKINFSAGKNEQVFHVELRDPDGNVPPLYKSNVFTADGKGSVVFQSAFNDKCGIWSAEVTNVNSGMKIAKKFRLCRR